MALLIKGFIIKNKQPHKNIWCYLLWRPLIHKWISMENINWYSQHKSLALLSKKNPFKIDDGTWDLLHSNIQYILPMSYRPLLLLHSRLVLQDQTAQILQGNEVTQVELDCSNMKTRSFTWNSSFTQYLTQRLCHPLYVFHIQHKSFIRKAVLELSTTWFGKGSEIPSQIV